MLDPNDGLPPSDLTPENAIIRVMLIKSGHVNIMLPSVMLCLEFGFWFNFLTTEINTLRRNLKSFLTFFYFQAKPLIAATIAMPMTEPLENDLY